jgi:hypothetical protein
MQNLYGEIITLLSLGEENKTATTATLGAMSIAWKSTTRFYPPGQRFSVQVELGTLNQVGNSGLL